MLMSRILLFTFVTIVIYLMVKYFMGLNDQLDLNLPSRFREETGGQVILHDNSK